MLWVGEQLKRGCRGTFQKKQQLNQAGIDCSDGNGNASTEKELESRMYDGRRGDVLEELNIIDAMLSNLQISLYSHLTSQETMLIPIYSDG